MKREYPFAIIEKLEVIYAGENMDSKIRVLDVDIDQCSAKEAMKKAKTGFIYHSIYELSYSCIKKLLD